MHYSLLEMQYNQEVYECEQQFYKSLNRLTSLSNNHIEHWLKLIKDLDPDESYRFEELNFKLDIREAIERIKKDVKSLIGINERRTEWSTNLEQIMWETLNSADVCLRYKLTPSELLQHEKDGLEYHEEDSEKVFYLMDCMDYFNESYEF